MESKTTDSDHELNNMLDEMQQSGMDKTREWVSVFQEALHYFFSDQLQGKKRHKDWDWVVINYIWPSAMQEISKLSKNHAKLIATPWEEDDVEAAEVFQGALQWLWQKPLNMRLNHIAAILPVLSCIDTFEIVIPFLGLASLTFETIVPSNEHNSPFWRFAIFFILLLSS